ncbi:MAG: hypothetical protein JNK70_13590, partial [Phycisphaerae bacterium]|nr:hypothetical protein [Phycisphaerae bacterium]
EIRVPAHPHRVEFSPDGRRAYTADHESNLVAVIDTATETRLWPEEVEGYSLGVQAPPRQGTIQGTAVEMHQIRQEAAARAGLGVAQLFVGYIARESASKGSAATN